MQQNILTAVLEAKYATAITEVNKTTEEVHFFICTPRADQIVADW